MPTGIINGEGSIPASWNSLSYAKDVQGAPSTREATPIRRPHSNTSTASLMRSPILLPPQQRLESDCQTQCTADGEKSINSYAARPHFKPLKRALGHACTLCQLCLRQVPAEPNLRESSARLAQRLIFSHRHIVFHNSSFLAS